MNNDERINDERNNNESNNDESKNDESKNDESVNYNNEYIQIILNQTSYTEKKAKEKLLLWDNNHINVIKEYLNPNFNKKSNQTNNKTNNQKIFSEIRNFMDNIKYKSNH